MPFTKDEPTIQDFIKAFGDGVVGEKDRYADVRTGSLLNHIAGPAAIKWSQETARDTDLFRNIYFSSADDVELTNIGQTRYSIPRKLDTQGIGTAALSRTNSSAGAGIFPAGTRLTVFDVNGLLESITYEITSDVIVSASATSAVVPIHAVNYGSGVAVNASNVTSFIRLEDPVWDNTWTINSVSCVDGTNFEPADQYRARVNSTLIATRNGYVPELMQTCLNAGATNVVLYQSNFAGNNNDFGLNICYVGDNGFNSSIDLCNACKVALESSRVLGANLAVLPMQAFALNINANVYLWDSPANFDTSLLTNVLTATLVGEFSGSKGFTYTRDQLSGALMAASNAVEFATFTTPATDAPIMQTLGGLLNFPYILNKYVVGSVNLTFLNPI